MTEDLQAQFIVMSPSEGGEPSPTVLMIHNQVFEPGTLSTTEGIDALLSGNPDFQGFVRDMLNRHCSGDWGNVDQDDREAVPSDSIQRVSRFYANKRPGEPKDQGRVYVTLEIKEA